MFHFFFRLMQIVYVIYRYGFRVSIWKKQNFFLCALSYFNPWNYNRKQISRGAAARIVLERLGPIFIKMGQLLSTRRDFLPNDVIEELEQLQDQVPPFSHHTAFQIIEKSLNCPLHEVFAHIDDQHFASASIAQVYGARLKNGDSVVIKVMRPNLLKIVNQDLRLMRVCARLIECTMGKKVKSLRLSELVGEFQTIIHNELDFNQEAANASQLKRNFLHSHMLYVPKIYWEYVSSHILVMERVHGVRISDIPALQAAHINLKLLSEYGVEIFFTQVLRDCFFHADMHPGNLFVDTKNPERPRYLGVDFGIMGSLNEEDQHYIASNLLAFFRRDYQRVAALHIESGWIPEDTRADQFAAAVRSVCEPIFEKPLKDISFGLLLLQLFRIAHRFEMYVQPQLMLLQKTLFAVEGLGRQLYPELDIYQTGRPFLEKWMRERNNIFRFIKKGFQYAPDYLRQWTKTQFQVSRLIQNTYCAQKNKRKKSFSFVWIGASCLLVFVYAYCELWRVPMWLHAAEWVSGCGALFFLMRALRTV